MSDLVGRGVFSAWADRNVFTAVVRIDKIGGIEWQGEINCAHLYLRLSGRAADDVFSGLGGRFTADR